MNVGLRRLLKHAKHPAAFPLFTDSQAALRRVQDDTPGPGQQAAREAIDLAGQINQQAAPLTEVGARSQGSRRQRKGRLLRRTGSGGGFM